MVKKIWHTIYLEVLAVVALTLLQISCMENELVKTSNVKEGVPITVNFNLSGIYVPDVTVETRTGGSDLSELNNLAILIYDKDGNYQQTVGTTEGTLRLGTSETISNAVRYSVSFQTTSGEKNLLVIGNRGNEFWTTDSEIDITKMSFEELRSQLLSLKYSEENGEISTPLYIISSDQMLISGWNSGVVFDTNGSVVDWGENGDEDNGVAVWLKRVMAHVTFQIPSASTKTDESIITFTPTSYKIYNVPTKCMLANQDGELTPDDGVAYMNVTSTNISAAEDGYFSFDFYMPENINEYVTDNNGMDITYNMRDEWTGDATVAAEKVWDYAPAHSSFVVIDGSYEQEDLEGNIVYTGNVQYTIHLGNFSNGRYGDFSIKRNSSYTYKVKVTGVKNIIAEVIEKNEKQSGAEGQIYSYTGSVFTYNLDAHYEKVYLEYNLTSIADAVKTAVNSESVSVDEAIANNLVLVIQSEAMDYVKESDYYTTRNKRGILKPYKVYIDASNGRYPNGFSPDEAKKDVLDGEGTGITPEKGFDYKWVEMYPQSTPNFLANYPGVSEWSREEGISADVYGGNPTTESEKLIDVYDAIVGMGKAVKKIYESKSDEIQTGTINEDKILITQTSEGYKAYFTAFVNEYYYYKHPLTKTPVTVWSVFVNKIPREMAIAMSSKVSEDGNSSFNEVYSYISQLSMQTPYSDRDDMVMEAFGLETYNETPLTLTAFSDQITPRGLSDGNGRQNQFKWLLDSRLWNDYISDSNNGYKKSNSTLHSDHKLNDAYTRRYYDNACLSRNRDLNGNGRIDDNEVRWYLASVNEYLRMGLSTSAISNSAHLYQGDKSQMTYSGYKEGSYINLGALYFTSSDNNERIYWAVEKGAWGHPTSHDLNEKTPLPIRCVRVLPAVGEGIDSHQITDLNVVPESFFKSHYVDENYVLEFKNRMVADMFRARTDASLVEHNENGMANKFSDGIIIAEKYYNTNYRYYTIAELNGIRYPYSSSDYRKSTKIDPCAFYNEDGERWRMPNLNELVMMKRAGVIDNSYTIPCCTQFSNSKVRLGFKTDSGVINCTLGDFNEQGNYWSNLYEYNTFRCVRDVPSGYVFPTSD